MKKCEFAQQILLYLDVMVGGDRLKIDPVKIHTIMNWPRSMIMTKVRSIARACQYLCKFSPHFSSIAALLHALTKGGTKFVWNNDQEQAFIILKKNICEALLLGLLNMQKSFEIEADT